DLAARAMARSMAAEMHSSFAALRRNHSMNIRRIYPAADLSPEVQADVIRILQIWAEARARFGGEGDFLFGDWSAADMMFAPVVTRFITYSIPLPRFALPYAQAVISHPHMQEWVGGARAEDWVIEKFEGPVEG
ncbi:MAG: glutathione S-transferase family protein, partial [Sphingopyxis sp.]|nr:glutathione S-transferase family protein [Sphingopyxis sp.]